MGINCWMSDVCPDYSAGHKRRSHHLRLTVECVRLEDKSCPFIGKSCNLEKIRKVKEKLKEV